MIIVRNKLFQTVPIIDEKGNTIMLDSREKMTLNFDEKSIPEVLKNMEKEDFIKIKIV